MICSHGQNQPSPLEKLPEDVVLQILGLLDYADIMRVRGVSRNDTANAITQQGLQVSRSLSNTTRLRSLWIIFILDHDLGPMVQKRLDAQTSAELESVVARKVRADRIWMDNNAAHVPHRPPELTHDVPKDGFQGTDYLIAPGGRWVFRREGTRVTYADLDFPARGWKTLIQHGDTAPNTLVSYELIRDSAYFSLRLAACGTRKMSGGTAGSESESESEGGTWCSVHTVSVSFDGEGNIDGLQASLLSIFTLGGGQKIDAINVYRDRMAIALAETGVHRIIDWRAANGCKDTFPEIRLGGMSVPAKVRPEFAVTLPINGVI